MDIAVLSLFICILLGCVTLGISITYALLLGYALFAAYSLWKGFSLKEVLAISFQGIKTAKNILITFVLIGVLTALWRAGGTIPAIVCYSAQIMRPAYFVVITFLLNCLVSFLTGTAFGTAATMGSICMTMAFPMNIDPVMLGGAVLSGVYFGDRCSPVSTSALLIAELTKTDLYANIRNMLKTAVVPFLLTCVIYTLYGLITPSAPSETMDIYAVFAGTFQMGIVTFIPAVLILLLSLAKLPVKTTMLASIAASALLCLAYQHLSPAELLRFSVLGYTAADPGLAPMLNGGGILSMLRVAIIVCISSTYSGIFEKTGLLEPVRKLIEACGRKCSSYTVILIVSVLSGAIACNQTLSIMLTKQLCEHIEAQKERLALHLENSAVVIAPLIPWSIAGSVPLASAGAPARSFAAAFFLMLLPLCSLMLTSRAHPAGRGFSR